MISSCQPVAETEIEWPVSTSEATEVGTTSVIINFNVDEEKLPEGASMGIIYSTDSNPTLENGTRVVAAPKTKSTVYSVEISGLVPATQYYYRPFVEAEKVFYGDIMSFTTAELIPVAKVVIEHGNAELVLGETQTLTLKIDPENASDQTAVWTSSDEKIATVVDGVVSAVSIGQAEIVAHVGGISATCLISVIRNPDGIIHFADARSF